MSQSKLFEETSLFVCKHVEVDGLSVSKANKVLGIFQAIRIRFEDGEILLEGEMTLKKILLEEVRTVVRRDEHAE